MNIVQMPDLLIKGVVRADPERVSNNGSVVNNWTGARVSLLGIREQWRVQFSFKRILQEQEGEVFEFIDALDSGAHLFRAPFPGVCRGGKGAGSIQLNGAHAAGVRTLQLRGFSGSFSPAIAGGDSLELGLQGTRCRASVSSQAAGTATAGIWPRLSRALPDGTEVKLADAQFLWRIEDEARMPLEAGVRRRQALSFSAITEVLYTGHPAL